MAEFTDDRHQLTPIKTFAISSTDRHIFCTSRRLRARVRKCWWWCNRPPIGMIPAAIRSGKRQGDRPINTPDALKSKYKPRVLRATTCLFRTASKVRVDGVCTCRRFARLVPLSVGGICQLRGTRACRRI
jgi:hypothetical protein